MQNLNDYGAYMMKKLKITNFFMLTIAGIVNAFGILCF